LLTNEHRPIPLSLDGSLASFKPIVDHPSSPFLPYVVIDFGFEGLIDNSEGQTSFYESQKVGRAYNLTSGAHIILDALHFSHPKIVPSTELLFSENPFYLIDFALFECCLILF
jgi:hypothetical protein